MSVRPATPQYPSGVSIEEALERTGWVLPDGRFETAADGRVDLDALRVEAVVPAWAFTASVIG